MNSTEIICAARDLDIRLFTTKEDLIGYAPKNKMPEWLLEGIKANKEVLLHDLLLKEALHYLNERYVEGADLSVLSAPEQCISEAYGSTSPEEYRAAIREFVRAGLRAYAKAKTQVEKNAGRER